jgi:hypothetical protein
MHPIQRALVGYVIVDTRTSLPPGTSLVPVPGTRFSVPVLDDADVPALWRPIGFAPDLLSGLVVRDLRRDDIRDLLAREGLGAVAEVTWDAGWYVGEVRVHTRDLDTALGQLADAMAHRMPGRYVPTSLARTRLDRMAISAPTDAAHARAMAAWSGDDRDLHGSVVSDRGDAWDATLGDALVHAANVRDGAAQVEALRTALGFGVRSVSWIEAGALRLRLELADYTPNTTA